MTGVSHLFNLGYRDTWAEGGSRSRDAEGVEGVGNAEGVPLPSRLGGLGEYVSSPSGVRGGAPAEKRISVLSKRHRMPVVETFVVN